MDKTGNYNKIMALGGWLDRFLAEPLSPWDIDGLANDALTLLNIDHVRSEEDPVTTGLVVLLEDRNISNKFRDRSNKSSGLLRLPWTINGVDLSKHIPITNFTADEHAEIFHDISVTFVVGMHIGRTIRELQINFDTPWEYVLTKSMQHRDDGHNLLRIFLYGYNNVKEVLVEKGRRIAIVNKMTFPDKTEWIRFPALASRIFVTFLAAGGRDYGRLCKNCNKFILAERKGCRLFCGNRCRVAHKRTVEKKRGA